MKFPRHKLHADKPRVFWSRGATWTICGKKQGNTKQRYYPASLRSCHVPVTVMRWKQTVTVALCVCACVCVCVCVQTYYIPVRICSALLSGINGSHLESVSQCVYCFHRWSSDTVWVTEINDSRSGSADGKNNSPSRTYTHNTWRCTVC